jgi:hypothetical protein
MFRCRELNQPPHPPLRGTFSLAGEKAALPARDTGRRTKEVVGNSPGITCSVTL